MSENKTVFQKIATNRIVENPLNERTMDSRKIIDLADNIDANGLFHPILVYPNGDEYVIISGHRRFEAARALGWTEVPCFIREKPADSFEEQELLASGNIHRSSPEEVKNEARLVKRNWNEMPEDRKARLREEYKKAFIEDNSNNPAYLADPAGYLRSMFNPLHTYIRSVTGLDVSNSTVSKLIRDNDEVPVQTQEEVEQEAKKKSEKITAKKIIKQFDKLIGMIEVFDPDDPASAIILDEVRSKLIDLKHSIVEEGE